MTSLAIFLTEAYADWEAAMLSAVARGFYGVDVVAVTLDGLPVTSAGGFRVTPASTLDAALETADGIAVIGGGVWRKPDAPDIGARLRAAATAGKVVAGICDGTRSLAAAGLLDRVAHTSNDADTLDVAGYGGAPRYRQSAAAVRDGRIVTASGLQPVSFMAEVLWVLGAGDVRLEQYRGMLGAEHAGRIAA